MKKRLCRNIALLLCMFMLFSNFAGVTAFAETADDTVPEAASAETAVTEQVPEEEVPAEEPASEQPAEEVPATEPMDEKPADVEESAPNTIVRSVIQRPGKRAIAEDEERYGYTFTTFEDLKIMVADPESYDGDWTYVGTEPFVFKESIELSADLDLSLAKAIVPEGVSVTFKEYYRNMLTVSDLLVEGSLTTDYLWVTDGKVEVTGKLHVLAGPSGSVWVFSKEMISGMENVTVDDCGISYYWECTDAAEFARLIKMIDPNSAYEEHFEIIYEMADNDTVESSLVIPENAYVSVYTYEDEETAEPKVLTIPKGVTLTVNTEDMYFDTSVSVEGKLVNNMRLTFSAWSGMERMSFENGGEYSGTGVTRVYGVTAENSLEKLLPGLDLTAFDRTNRYEDDFNWIELRYVQGLARLEAPTELRWGYVITSGYDEETGKWVADKAESMPGVFCWKNTPPYNGVVEVACYRVAEGREEQILCYEVDYSEYEQIVYHYDYNQSLVYTDEYENLESGDYYFTVTNKGDGVETRDSETVTSAVWTYQRPETAMSGCTDPVWDGDTIKWTGPVDGEKYMIEVYHAFSAYDEAEYIGGYTWVDAPEASVSRFFGCGPGYYFARVRTLSPDIEEKRHSEWSELSEPYYYSAPTSGTCGNDLMWTFNEEDGVLTISGTGDMYDFTFEGAPWYPIMLESEAYVEAVVVEEGVTSIGDNAFGMLSVRNIVLPDSLKTIGQAAFESTQISQITIPSSVTTIRKFAFWNCFSLTSIVIPDNVTSLGERVFNNCYTLGTVTIGSGVKKIDSGAFKWCEGLQSVHFLGDAPVIAADAFPDITTTCYYPAGNDTWTADMKQNYGGRLFWEVLEDGENFLVAGGEYAEGLYWILDSAGTLTITGNGTMDDHGAIATPWGWHDMAQYRVKKAVVGGGVQNIGSHSFEGLDALKRIEVEAGVARVDAYGFMDCKNLEAVVFCGDAPKFDSTAFWNTTTTCYYPAGNETWEAVAGNHYGGKLTWVAYYPVVEGADATVSTSNQDHKIRVDGEVSKFKSVSIDGKLVDPANYTVTEGSTVITFRSDYLATLAEGEHTVTITFTDGVATTGLTLVAGNILGDLNGDDSVNDDDVILLLWHTLLPDMYPIEGEADFNADGSVNDEDVIYLLWHTLLPDLYPL